MNHKNFCYILLRNLYITTYYPEGLSLLSLILLSTRLFDINKQIDYINYMSSIWLSIPKDKTHDGSFQINANKSQLMHIENLKQDFDVLIFELWSSRTTLILSVIFIIVYIVSWGWMSYAVKETPNINDISLKTILLLAIFAAIDIAASAGFVLVRLIMFFIRDNNFPKSMRNPSFAKEHDQLAAISALRISILQSGPGSIDIFVSVIIGFLTGLRIYSVVCAIKFYKKFRTNWYKSYKSSTIYSTDRSHTDGYHLENFSIKSGHYLTSNRTSNRTSSSPTEQARNKFKLKGKSKDGHYSLNGDSIVSRDLFEIKVQAADMPLNMQRTAKTLVVNACSLYTTEKYIAENIKQDFDKEYGPTWHCIVGRNWGSCVTHSKQCYIRLLYKDLTILIYKSS